MVKITNSTNSARGEARRALAGCTPILHLVTDDFAQVQAILQEAFFDSAGDRSVYIPGRRSQNYIRLEDILKKSRARKKVSFEEEDTDLWLTLLEKDQVVIYLAADEKGELDKTHLKYLMDYQELCSASRYAGEPGPRSCMVIYGRQVKIPSVLEPHVARIELPALNQEDFRLLLSEYWDRPKDPREWEQYNEKMKDLSGWYADNLAGFPEQKVRNILDSIHYGSADETRLLNRKIAEAVIREAKNKQLKARGRLECMEARDEGQGLKPVRKWLRKHRANIRRTDFDSEKDITKGILLLGLPGTGKSMMAKACAAILGLPLIKLEMSRILDKHLGESDKNMDEILEDLQSAGAPCVLWMDEVEKLWENGGDDSGSAAMTRIFAKLLTFMQEMKRSVFIVATANDISAISTKHPEFLRSGRFSMIFSLMLPTYEECVSIMNDNIRHHLGSENKQLARELVDICAALDQEDYACFLTGADITALANEMVIEMDLLPGSKVYEATGWSESRRAAARDAMKRAVAQGRFTVDSRIRKTLETAALTYMTVLQENTHPANSEQPLFSRETYTPDKATPDSKKDWMDMRQMPLCLNIPDSQYKHLSLYDQRMVRWIGNTMDRLLKEQHR